jgi:hypothetical protein
MDESKSSASENNQCALIGAECAPTALALRDIGRGSVHSTIVDCGDATGVGEGFALALNAMRTNANGLMMNVVMPATHPNQEDN